MACLFLTSGFSLKIRIDTSTNMIYAIDANSLNHTHAVFNASMLKVLTNVYPEDQIAFYSESDHQDRVRDFLGDQEKVRLQFFPIRKKTVRNDKIGKIIKTTRNTVSDLLLFIRIFANANKSKTGKVFVFKAHPVSLLMIKYLKKVYKNTEIMLVMHGEIEFIYSADNSWERKMGSIYKRLIDTHANNLRYILLNKISKKRLVQDGHLYSEEVIEIDHPYPYSDRPHAPLHPAPSPVNIGQVGSLATRKNAHLVYKLAEMLSKEIADGLLRFVTIGPIDKDAEAYKNDLVEDFVSENPSEYISRETFTSETQKIDYAVFFYEPHQFIFRASGSIMDVIDFVRPIVALQHPFFDYLSSEVGNIGFLCKDLEEMASTVARIAQRDPAVVGQYDEQCANLDRFKRMHSAEHIAVDFKKQANISVH